MLFFGHTGITLGVAAALANLPPCKAKIIGYKRPPSSSPSPSPSGTGRSPFDSLAEFVDIRILLIGSLLPDIIDKPLGHLLFRQELSNGRTFAHTIVFLLAIFSLGMYLYRRSRRKWLLALSFGTATHLLLDQMWRDPRTLFWPTFGLAFEKGDISDWIPKMLRGVITNPSVYVPEAIGLVLIGSLAYVVVSRRRVHAFLKNGSVR